MLKHQAAERSCQKAEYQSVPNQRPAPQHARVLDAALKPGSTVCTGIPLGVHLFFYKSRVQLLESGLCLMLE